MVQNDVLHGFIVKYVQELPELKATLYRMEYQKNGADLVWLEREDDNKTFSISFKTIPQDDTGVFHILEHSVLCGSDKYPVREPFVELIKSSLQTFLNAMTFGDKTMYPLSSRNDQDFLNLIDVYMDAVLHPLSINDPHAFRQEGWHYELDEPDGELRCNGVVYNEMKGAYGDADSVLGYALNRQLFPDNCYGCESGGYPAHITDLTYEDYQASHRRFYHPSNSYIFLDGKVDMDAVLAKLDGFLCDYDRLEVDADIPMQDVVTPEEVCVPYEIGEEEDPENKVLLAKGWVHSTFDDQETSVALSVLSDVLCGNNESPLKKALVERELAEDVELQNNGVQQQYVTLIVRNTSMEKAAQVWQTVEDTLRDQVENGLDHDRLNAVLNRYEFTVREKDYGSMPRGLVYAIMAMDSWLYGGDPAAALVYDDIFKALRAKIAGGGFEELLQRILLDNPHHAQVVLQPSQTLGKEKQEQERQRLAVIKAGWSEEETARVIEQFHALRERQERPDTPEALATLPTLRLSDISPTVSDKSPAVTTVDGVTVLRPEVDTDGIAYLELMFSLQDLTLEELTKAGYLRVMGDLATEHYSVNELQSEIEGCLGRFGVAATVTAKRGQTTECTPYLSVSVSVLESRIDDAVRIIDEVLNHTRFDDTRFIGQLLRQGRISSEQGIMNAGDSYAARRNAACFSAQGAVREAISGITSLRWLQRTDDCFATDGAAACAELAGFAARLFTRERLTLCIGGEVPDAKVSALIGCLSSAPMGERVSYQPMEKGGRGYSIPAEVGYAARGGNLFAVGEQYSGTANVAAQMLTYDYLWNTIRVKGGAYGTRLSVQSDGDISITSYRDPSAAQSLQSFSGVGAALRAMCDSGESMDRYIISTIGEFQPVLTARRVTLQALMRYLNGITVEERQRIRTGILATTADDLRRFSEVLDRICETSNVCVIGSRDALDACGETLACVESLQ